MQFKIKHSWLYMFFQMARTGSWKSIPQGPLESRPLRMYRTCDELPLTIFIECICDNDFKGLVIEGTADDRQTNEAWLIILSQYLELRDQGAGELWQLTKEIVRLQSHLYITEKCISFLRDTYSEEVGKALTKLGYNFRPLSKEPEVYATILDTIVQRSKTKYIRLQQLLNEYSEKIKNSKEVKVTRADFEDLLISIEEMQKTSYKMEDLTVGKFVILEKRLNRRIERQNAKHGH